MSEDIMTNTEPVEQQNLEAAADEDGILVDDTAPEPLPQQLNVPEDFPIADETFASFRDRAASLGLSQEQAEGLLQWCADQHRVESLAMDRLPADTIQRWSEEIQGDPEFGGAHFTQTMACGIKALKTFDPDGSIRQLLVETGMQHCPAIIRMAARIGARMSEHGYVTSNGQAAGPTAPLEQRLYKGGK